MTNTLFKCKKWFMSHDLSKERFDLLNWAVPSDLDFKWEHFEHPPFEDLSNFGVISDPATGERIAILRPAKCQVKELSDRLDELELLRSCNVKLAKSTPLIYNDEIYLWVSYMRGDTPYFYRGQRRVLTTEQQNNMVRHALGVADYNSQAYIERRAPLYDIIHPAQTRIIDNDFVFLDLNLAIEPMDEAQYRRKMARIEELYLPFLDQQEGRLLERRLKVFAREAAGWKSHPRLPYSAGKVALAS